MNRRQLLRGGAVLGVSAAGFAGWRYWPPEGFTHPCLGALPQEVRNQEPVLDAFADLDIAQVWDCHVHLVGIGDDHSGAWVNEQMSSVLHPIQYAQNAFYLNAACVNHGTGAVDRRYVDRLRALIEGMPAGYKALLFAFDQHHDERGQSVAERSTFHVPNEYARVVASRWPQHFEWAASIHPYRPDAVEGLRQAARSGARAVKWLPVAMGIDPASSRCDAFYEALAKLDLPLITHAGMELAVLGGDRQEYGNPLRLRRALERGVTVVVAHCASFGKDQDTDRGGNGPAVASFKLFARLMDEPGYAGRLFGDVSAVTQINRVGVVKELLSRTDWHARLLNGSDYPLPGVMPLFSTQRLVELDLLDSKLAEVISGVRRYNPLLFDFLLKRHIAYHGRRFAPSVFETRRFFDRSAHV